MRVLHVNMSLDPQSGGGTAERTVRLIGALDRAGVRCSALTVETKGSRQPRAELAAHVTTLPCLSQRFYLPTFAPRRILDAVRDADVVHLMGHWTVLNALAYAAARRLGKPYVTCPAGALPIYGRSRTLKRSYNAAIGRRIVQEAAGHVAITAAEREAFASYGVDPGDVVVIPNGVDAPSATPQLVDAGSLHSSLGLTGEPFILFVGRLNRIKGPDLLVEAFAAAAGAVGGCHLVVAGPDEGLRPELEGLARRLGVADRVHFPGPLHGAVKDAAFRAAALLVVPSRHEAMSIVALEAGAVGTPVLLTSECGFDDVQGRGGAVVPATAIGLEDGLRRLLADPAALAAEGERLQAFVLNRYTWQRAASDYLRLYEGLGIEASGPTRVPADRRQLR